ncbi:MAG: triose-phosphate isomerase [Clostridia bacterium]|nr:triose-phosphate isomerase [Clostridia bacterium]
MNKSVRKAVIAGNWKMNMTPSEAEKLVNELKPMVEGKNGCDIVVCVPFVDIATVVNAVKGTNVKVGAQNVHFKKNGAYTGEISADMLKECGVEYVVIGHSERRQYFGETDETVNLRLKAALDAGITPILCVGEVLTEREQDVTAEVVARQTKIALLDVDADAVKNVIIAYEPVWAIGTGKTATSDQADEVCGIIRDVLAAKYGKDVAEAVTIQYGGSMKPDNAAELLSKYHVDGGLIGGASLKAADFTAIVDAAQ